MCCELVREMHVIVMHAGPFVLLLCLVHSFIFFPFLSLFILFLQSLHSLTSLSLISKPISIQVVVMVSVVLHRSLANNISKKGLCE